MMDCLRRRDGRRQGEFFSKSSFSLLLILLLLQEDMIEIHGSWYDPSNPVVCYDGSLRSDLYDKVTPQNFAILI